MGTSSPFETEVRIIPADTQAAEGSVCMCMELGEQAGMPTLEHLPPSPGARGLF